MSDVLQQSVSVREQPRKEQHRAPYRFVRPYRVLITRTHEEQAQLLEQLRYKTYSRFSLRQRIMQRLGDFGREYFPFAAKYRWRP